MSMRKTLIQGIKHSLRADPGQCLKGHRHRYANQSSGAAALTKNKRKIKTYIYILFGGDVLFACALLPLCYFLSLILGTKH